MARMKLSALIAVGLLTAVPATSVATVHKATFDVTVSGSQVTEWTERTHQTGGDCKGRTFERGAGHETVWFKSLKKVRYSALGFGGRATIYPATGSAARYGIYSYGKTERDGVYVYSKDANGPCATPADDYTGTYDCTTLSRHYNVSLVYDGKRIGVVTGSGVGPADTPFSTCPIENSPDV